MVDRIKASVDIHASAKKCYDRWHEFDQFPKFMSRIDQVQQLSDGIWRWVIATPLGRYLQWNIAVSSDDRNRCMSWHTVPGDEQVSKVKVQGTTRFDEIKPNLTRVTCAVQFEMPGQPVMEAVTELLMHPQSILEEEMNHFKNRVEGTHKPAEKVNRGKTLTSSQPSPEHSYMGPFDIEEVLADEGVEVSEIEDPAIREMIHEESPYLGVEGAWESEDAWPESETQTPFKFDVFENSLDIAEEDDLNNFTEDLDDNIDSTFFTGQTMEEYEMVQEAEQQRSTSRARERTQSEL